MSTIVIDDSPFARRRLHWTVERLHPTQGWICTGNFQTLAILAARRKLRMTPDLLAAFVRMRAFGHLLAHLGHAHAAVRGYTWPEDASNAARTQLRAERQLQTSRTQKTTWSLGGEAHTPAAYTPCPCCVLDWLKDINRLQQAFGLPHIFTQHLPSPLDIPAHERLRQRAIIQACLPPDPAYLRVLFIAYPLHTPDKVSPKGHAHGTAPSPRPV